MLPILQPWSSAPEQTPLAAAAVHVWRVSLEQPPALVQTLQQVLSADEQTRAHRFHFEKDRRHFIVARAALRKLLGRYLGMDATDLRFSYSDYGKPHLAESPAQLNFNLAHSGRLAVFAFTEIGEIGVDLEEVRPEFTGDEIARRFFSASEVACLDQLSADARVWAFFNCWTRKEAFIKAKGVGLSLALDQFDVALLATDEPAVLRTGWDESEAERWGLRALELGPDYVGAVAVEAHDWQLSCWEFAP